MHRDGAVPEMRKTSTFRHTAAKGLYEKMNAVICRILYTVAIYIT